MDNFFETSRKTLKKRGRGPGGPLFRMFRAFFNLGLALLLAGLLVVFGLYFYLVRVNESELERRYPDLAQSSYVYDRDGQQIATIPGAQVRETVGAEGLGENLPRAVVAVEDQRFYEHSGVDVEGVGRAAWRDLRSWEVREGGSTITEQLVKNLFVPEEEWMEVSFWRRLAQAELAFAYERRHSKEEILTAYLNTVYFGNGAYGAELAAQRYFGKDARELTLSEAAALAGFLHAPSTYVPGDAENLRRATERRDEVLALMHEQGMVSAAERRDAADEPLEFAPAPPADDPVHEPFVDRVSREVEEELGDGALERGGLRIQTTLDPDMQRAAVESKDGVLSEDGDPSAAVATVEPQSGAVRALAGKEDGFNLAIDARRQPGSSFKPFVLAEALRQGVSPETVYVSQDLNFSFDGDDYTVVNYDSIERGPIDLRQATVESDNAVYVQLAADLGFADVAALAQEMGVTTPVGPYPSTAIGGLGEGVSVLDMASAYATFAGAGIYREPYAVERIERVDYGGRETAYDHRTTGRRVLSGNQAAAATDILRSVAETRSATGSHDLDEELGRPSAGKTGTTDEFMDAWYVGYTPRLSTAVWVGYPEGRRSMTGIHGLEEVNGASLPLDIWADYMAQTTADAPPLDFPEASFDEFGVRYSGYAGTPPGPEFTMTGGG